MDNKNNEPIVLGELKKQKTSKPIFVIIVFILLLGTCFGLPYIEEYMSTNDNALTRLYNTYFGDNETPVYVPSKTTEKVIQGIKLIDSQVSFKYDTLTLSNFGMDGASISYKAKGPKSTINLDEKKVFLEIYGTTQNFLTRVKLTGTYDDNLKEVTNTLSTLTFNPSSKYYAKIVELKLDDYPDFDFKGSTLTCKNSNNTYVYTFNNGALKLIDHSYTFRDKTDMTIYMKELNDNNMKTNLVNTFTNCSSKTEEDDDGFIFTATYDLENVKVSDLSPYVDYNYFNVNTTPKEVDYDLISKGYKCS